MNSRDRTRSRLLAVSLALLMLVSVGSVAFAGGAAAQSTGGTYDNLYPNNNQNVDDELNIPSGNGTMELVGNVGAEEGPEVTPNGTIEIHGDERNQTFDGLQFGQNRIEAINDETYDNHTHLLQNFGPDFNASVNGTQSANATELALIELDPQSEFSQIEGLDGNINGSHDAILVGPANASSDVDASPFSNDQNDMHERATQLNSTVDYNLTKHVTGSQNTPGQTSNQFNINNGSIVAFSVDNDELGGDDNKGADSTLLAEGDDYSAVFSNLLGNENENDLTNENIDEVKFAVGTFQDTTVAIEEVRIGDFGSSFDDTNNIKNAETIHSEKITVETKSGKVNPGYESYYSNLTAALAATESDRTADTVKLDAGHYLNYTQTLDIRSNVTINTTNSVSSNAPIDRVTAQYEDTGLVGDSSADGSEAVINASLEITGANTKLDNVVVANRSDAEYSPVDDVPLVNVSAANVAFDNTIFNTTGPNTTAVKVNNTNSLNLLYGSPSGVPNGTSVTNSVFLSDSPVEFDGSIGLNLRNNTNNGTIADNFFIGFEQPLNKSGSAANTERIYNANRDQFFDDVSQDPGVNITTDNAPNRASNRFNNTHVAQSAIVLNGTSPNISNAVGTSIYANINQSDRIAGDNATIEVSGGTYDDSAGAQGGTGSDFLNISTPNVTVNGAGTDSTVVYAPTSAANPDNESIILNSPESVTFQNINVTGGNISVRALNDDTVEPDATIDNVILNEGGANITANASSLTVTDVTFRSAKRGAINLTDTLNDTSGDLTVENVDVNGFAPPASAGSGEPTAALNATAGVGANVTIRQFNVTTGGTQLPSGVTSINLNEVGPTGTVTIEKSSLTDGGSGTGIALKQYRAGGWDDLSYSYSVDIQNNVLTSTGAGFTGVSLDTVNLSNSITREDYLRYYDGRDNATGPQYNNDDGDFLLNGSTDDVYTLLSSNSTLQTETGGTLADNTIVSSDASGGIGIQIVNGSFVNEDARAYWQANDVGERQGADPLQVNNINSGGPRYGELVIASDRTTRDTSVAIDNNDIAGFERVVESRDNVSAAAYDRIVSDNKLGTVVTGPNPSSAASGTGFAEAYGFSGRTDVVGSGDSVSDTDGYLPGTFNASLALLNDSAAHNYPDVSDPYDESSPFTPQLVLRVPDVTSNNAPQVYNHTENGDTVVVPGLNRTQISGEQQSVEVRNSIIINGSNEYLNNHRIQDLTINASDSRAGLNVSNEGANNTQSEFHNLVIDAGTGVNVTTDGGDLKQSDVAVINLTDSDIYARNDGFETGPDADGREGFVIHNNNFYGPDVGTTNSVGIDLANVTAPGKPATDVVGVNVTDNYVESFETQVNLSDNSNLGFNASDLLGLSSPNTAGKKVTVSGNTFEQAVLIYNTTEGADTKEQVANNTLYGSIDKADARASAAFDKNGDPGVIGDVAILSVEHPESQSANVVYNESVTLGDSLNATESGGGITAIEVRGPQYGVEATDSFRGAEAIVAPAGLGNASSKPALKITPANNASNITVDGLTLLGVSHAYVSNASGSVVGDQRVGGINAETVAPTSVVNVSTEQTSTTTLEYVNHTYINNTAVSLVTREAQVNATNNQVRSPLQTVATPVNRTAGIRVTNTSSNQTVLKDVFVGDHQSAGTTATGVQVDGNLSVYDSTFIGNTTTQDHSPRAGFSNDTVRDASDVEVFGSGINVTNVSNVIDVPAGNQTDQLTLETVAINDYATSGINATRNAQLNVTGTDVTIDNANTGINVVEADSAGYVNVSNIEVLNSRDTGLNASASVPNMAIEVNLTDSTVADSAADGIHVGGDTALNLTNVTIDNSGDAGLNITDSSAADEASGNISANSFTNNGDAIYLGSQPNTPTGPSTAFNATLNYFGSSQGPNAGSDNGLAGSNADDISYDPYLTVEPTSSDVDVAAPDTTKRFANDVVITANSFTTVGIPTTPATEANELGEIFSFDVGTDGDSDDPTVYLFNDTDDSFDSAGARGFGNDYQVDAFDAFVVQNDRSTNVTATIAYVNEAEPAAPELISYEKGVNFVAPAAAGDVDSVLYPGSGQDYVAPGSFAAGQNLYGLDGSNASLEADLGGDDEARFNSSFGTSFRTGVGGADVHPHRGYFVIVNEPDNAGLLVPDRITEGGAPTAGEFSARFNQTGITG